MLAVFEVALCACLCRAADSADADQAATDVRRCLAAAGYNEVLLDLSAAGVTTVTVRLDSSRVDLVVDPRAPMTFLDMSVLKRLGYPLEPTGTDISFGGEREPLYTVTPSVLAIGGLVLDSFELKVTRIDHFARAAGIPAGMEIAGILGGAFLRECAALIDLEANRMFLRSPPEPEPSADTTAADTTDESQLDKIQRRLLEREKRMRR